tara:strand:- start:184 stop:297 length:114 start_codon:yes stop_codon:yes gene_type:complete
VKLLLVQVLQDLVVDTLLAVVVVVDPIIMLMDLKVGG